MGVAQFGAEAARAVHVEGAEGRDGVVNAAAGGCRRADGGHAARPRDLVHVPVSEEPAFQAAGVEVDAQPLAVLEDVAAAFFPVVVVEENDRGALGQLSQVVLEPAAHVGHGVAGLVVAAAHGGDDVVRAARVEGVVDGAVDGLVERFSAAALDQVVVTDAVVDGAAHVVGVHQRAVGAQAFLVADVARVDDEGGAREAGVGAQVVDPVVLPGGGGDLRVGEVDEAVGAIAADADVVGPQAEVAAALIAADGAEEGFGHVAGGRGDEDEARAGAPGQPVAARARGAHDVESVGDEHVAEELLAAVVAAVGVGIDVDAAFVGRRAVRRGGRGGQQCG